MGDALAMQGNPRGVNSAAHPARGRVRDGIGGARAFPVIVTRLTSLFPPLQRGDERGILLGAR